MKSPRTMSNQFALAAQGQCLANFLKAFSKGSVLRRIGPILDCQDCDELAGLLQVHGEKGALETLMLAHSKAEHCRIKEHLPYRARILPEVPLGRDPVE